MQRGWRFIDTGVNNAFLNMAIDEAILDEHIEGGMPPTLRVYQWDPPALSLGYNQSIVHDVDVAKCQEAGVEVVRRITGGGAVLHAQELTYSIVSAVNNGIPESVAGSYRFLSQGLIASYKILGLEVELKPGRNKTRSAACFSLTTLADLTHRGRKLAGSAQARRRNALLQHGSLPIQSHADILFSVLKFSSEASRQKTRLLYNKRMFVLNEVIGRDIDMQELKDDLRKGFTQALGIRFYDDGLTAAEIRRSQALAAEKYGTDAWNHRK
ncbi:MAG: lipoate--protein ligase family protein [Deltaproteobacteria bacterium]|nr:lipoate--protein ligase family protein [Deltaproteobacteria bacterium]